MKTKYKDLSGVRFDRLLVLEMVGRNKWSSPLWLCQCDCGAFTTLASGNLRTGKKQSCGCWRRENSRAKSTTHGETVGGKPSKEHDSWHSMIQRCENKSSSGYKWYGAKGVSVCGRWRESFSSFLEDMGRAPTKGHSIDRYPDKNGNYEPSNCRWATRKQQQNNLRSNTLITCDGLTLTQMEWSEKTGIARDTISHRIRAGWPLTVALSKPPIKTCPKGLKRK